MDISHTQTKQALSVLLFLMVLTQVVYTALYVAAQDVPRQWLWGLEGVLFVVLAAFAGSALVQAGRYTLGYSAILASAVLNVVQVGVGLTQFGPFREASQQVDGIAPAAAAVVAFSFFVYNAAKVLIGMAAIVFGMARLKDGSKAIGGLTVFAGVLAFATNAIVMIFGRMEMVPSGATGVVATFMLGLCLLHLRED